MTRTNGNVIIENIKIGDNHYEYEGHYCIKSQVISLPICEDQEDGKYWTWQSKTEDGSIINYGIHEKYYHYGPKLYDYPAYKN